MREKELILYRDFGEEGKLLEKMSWLMDHYTEAENGGRCGSMLYECMHALLEQAGRYGFEGNLWHCYLTNLLVNQENSYSCACEIQGEAEGTIHEAVLHDIQIFREFFAYDFTQMMEVLSAPAFSMALSYRGGGRSGRVYNTRIRQRICTLAKQLEEAQTAEQMKEALTQFYQEYGVGRFGLHKAFRVSHIEDGQGAGGARIEPILNIPHVKLADLVGYETAKKKLIDNTEAFVAGRKANNCLLYGDAGTGKSTSIKAIANEYYDRGLRIIEIYKHQFQDLHDVIAQIKNRNYKFIIYMDDLSFEDFEIEYKYLKAVIEGGLEKKPENVLIYATSNRRHLVREKFSDKKELDDDLHNNDTVQEKLSLVARFGVTIYFGAPDKSQFQEIVCALAERNGVKLQQEELLSEANKWELFHGGRSGRTAQQFIDYLLGSRQDG